MDASTDLDQLNSQQLRELAVRLIAEVRTKQTLIDKLTHEMATLKRLKFAATSEAYAGEKQRYTKKKETNRVFELWFEFLKLGNPEKCSPRVLEHFGDVWNTDFKEWWPHHAHIFEELEPLRMEVVTDLDYYNDVEG